MKRSRSSEQRHSQRSTDASSSSSAYTPSERQSKAIKMIMSMGFHEEQAVQALLDNDYIIQAATNSLLNSSSSSSSSSSATTISSSTRPTSSHTTNTSLTTVNPPIPIATLISEIIHCNCMINRLSQPSSRFPIVLTVAFSCCILAFLFLLL
jgi:hypothetical protein